MYIYLGGKSQGYSNGYLFFITKIHYLVRYKLIHISLIVIINFI